MMKLTDDHKGYIDKYWRSLTDATIANLLEVSKRQVNNYRSKRGYRRVTRKKEELPEIVKRGILSHYQELSVYALSVKYKVSRARVLRFLADEGSVSRCAGKTAAVRANDPETGPTLSSPITDKLRAITNRFGINTSKVRR
jgi:predicted transcriptional regulator